MELLVEYICPNAPCDFRGTKEQVTGHFFFCAHSPITVRVNGSIYHAGFPHDMGRLLDRMCVAYETMMNSSTHSKFTDGDRNLLAVFHQRLIWALSGDEGMQRQAMGLKADGGSDQ